MLRILGLAVCADVFVRRAAAGARGLRLWLEHPLLSWWTEVGDRLGDLPRDVLFIAASLTIPALLPLILKSRRPAGILVGLSVTAAAIPTLLHRIQGEGRPPHFTVGLLLLAAAATRLSGRRSPASEAGPMIAAAGAAAASLWLALMLRGTPGGGPLDLLEAGAEIMLLAGAALSALSSRGMRRTWLTPRGIPPLLVLLLLWVAAALWRDALLHLVRHLFSLGEAGLPVPLILGLFAPAAAALVFLLTGPEAERRRGLFLMVLLASARGPEEAALAARLAAAAILVSLPPVAGQARGPAGESGPDGG